jgi:hypothetical protein
LPQKDGNDKPLYDCEEVIFDSLVSQNSNKHLWVKKATGLGISEFTLRFMAGVAQYLYLAFVLEPIDTPLSGPVFFQLL